MAGHAEAPPESYRGVKAEPVLPGTPLPSWGGARRGKRTAQAFSTSCAPCMLQHWQSSRSHRHSYREGNFLAKSVSEKLHDICQHHDMVSKGDGIEMLGMWQMTMRRQVAFQQSRPPQR